MTFSVARGKPTADGAEISMPEDLILEKSLKEIVERVARSSLQVLLLGPPGTGKSELAKFIHARSDRARGQLVEVNCAAVSAGLFESELFGHARGAFTGSTGAKEGLLTRAHKGTLFLDEVAELPLEQQAKLLTALSARSFLPVGAAKPESSDFRLITATNQDLLRLVKEGRFREDLHRRIAGFVVTLRPLRDRQEVFDSIVEQAANMAFGDARRAEANAAIDTAKRLTRISNSWPGNIGDLKGFMKLAAIDLVAAEQRFKGEWEKRCRLDEEERGPALLAPGAAHTPEERAEYANLLRGCLDGTKAPRSRRSAAGSRDGSQRLAGRLLEGLPGPVGKEDLMSILGVKDVRTVKKTISRLDASGLLKDDGEGGVVAVWPPAHIRLFRRDEAGAWIPVPSGVVAQGYEGDRFRLEVSVKVSRKGIVGVVTHRRGSDPKLSTPLQQNERIDPAKVWPVEFELAEEPGVEQIFVHLSPPGNHRGAVPVPVTDEEPVLPGAGALRAGRELARLAWGEGWLHEHLLLHSARG